MDFSNVVIVGNLTRDPESKTLSTGTAVCKMGMAINNKRGGEGKDEVCFINIEAWQKTAELCEKYLKKGSCVLIQGRLKQSVWTDKDGNKRSEILVVADKVVFGPKAGGASSGGGDEYGSSEPAAAPRRSAPAAPNVGDDDSLPFMPNWA